MHDVRLVLELVAFGALCFAAGSGGAWLTSKLAKCCARCVELERRLAEARAETAEARAQLHAVELQVLGLRRGLVAAIGLLRGG